LCGGEHKISTPPLPLQILSGLRRLLIDNKCGEKKKKASQSIHSNRGKPYSPSGHPWHQAKQGYL